ATCWHGVLGEESDEGLPRDVLHGEIQSEEQYGGGIGAEERSGGGLRDWGRRDDVSDGGNVRNGDDSGRENYRADPRKLQAQAEGHHRGAGPAAADLQSYRGLWTLRAERAWVHLGTYGPRGRASQSCGAWRGGGRGSCRAA